MTGFPCKGKTVSKPVNGVHVVLVHIALPVRVPARAHGAGATEWRL